MLIHIQDPSFSKSYTLHEALLYSSIGSIRGGGVYAFATAGGVRLLLEDDIFIEFLRNSHFQLIIGTDEITNEKTLEQLTNLERAYRNFDVKAFCHNLNNITFHPKFCWFKKDKGGIIILGSGNLTEKGLRRNWEAFTVVEVSEKDMVEIEAQWNNWIGHNRSYIKAISDSDVINKAKTNLRVAKKIKSEVLPEIDIEEPLIETDTELEDKEDLEAWHYSETDSVLIAEIPKASKRWNQANFNKDTFVNYFGATPGDNRLRILLRNINTDGSLADTEIRPSVSVKSHNWRFELKAAAGLKYPSKGRPIAVFARISNRMFLYMLLMPRSTTYSEVLSYLDTLCTASPNLVRRCFANIKELKKYCGSLPIWNMHT